MRPGIVEHFQNLKLKLAELEDNGDFELKDLYHEKVKIPNRPKEQIWKNNRMEMRAQSMANIVPIFVTFAPKLFHHNNVRGTYARTSNFKVEPIRSIPLY